MTVTINLTLPSYLSVVTGVGQCVVDALEQTPAGAPTRQCLLLPTQQIPWDNCDCDGQVAQAIRSVYGSEKFPAAMTGAPWVRCGPHMWVVRVVVSVTRCVPRPDDQGNPPTCAAELAAAITLEHDRMAVRQALACCLIDLTTPPTVTGQPSSYLIGETLTVGEQGGCAGVETEYLLGFPGCTCPG